MTDRINQTPMEMWSEGETHQHYRDLIAKYEKEGEDPSFIRKMRSMQIMKGIQGLITVKKAYDKGRSPQDYGRTPPGVTLDSEREVGAKAIQRWIGQLPSQMHGEFYSLLEEYDKGYESRNESPAFSKAHDDMENFLSKNLIQKNQLKIRRRSEDKLIDSFLQQDTEYNMGK